jgi:hypothetical protein
MDSESSNDQTHSILARLRQLVEEAKQGNTNVLPELKKTLDQYPEIWRHYGDLAKHTEIKWLDLIAGNDACVRESVARTSRELKGELLAAGDSPLERLLIDRIILSQLIVSFFDTALAVAIEAPESRIRFLQQQLSMAQKRHVGAVRAIAEIRKLLP